MSTSRPLRGARVLFLFQTFALGGSERQSIHLAEHLRTAHGCTVEVLASDEEGQARDLLTQAAIPTGTLPLARPHRDLISWWRLRRVAARLRAHRPDLVLPVTSTPNVVCGLTWRRAGARACVWRQGDPGIALSGKPLERHSAQACSLAVANSDDGAAFLRDVLDVPEDRVRRIRNGVEVPERPFDPAPWRARLGADADTPVVTMIAHFEPRKDHATLLHAWRALLDRSRARPLLALAGLPGRTSGEADGLVASLDLSEHVRVLGPIEDVEGLLAASDLVVLASHREGMPNAVLEAMARRKAVVATDLPGTREALGPEAPDDLVPEGDADALATRILHHVSSPDECAARGEQNRRRVLERFERTRVCEATAALLASVLAEGAG